jgi:uncharacterized repeat protein (TIGR02543 family)
MCSFFGKVSRNLVLALIFTVLPVFSLNFSQSASAYQYPQTVKQKILTKIFIPVKNTKSFALKEFPKTSANLVTGSKSSLSANSALVCGDYTVDRSESIAISIIGNGKVEALNQRPNSSPVNWTVISTNPSALSTPNPTSYVVRNGDCPSFRFIADVDYDFNNVSINSSPGVSDNPYTLGRVLTSQTLVVTFTKKKFSLTYSAGIGGKVNNLATLSQIVDYGMSGDVVTAQPDPGFHFLQWSDGNVNPSRQDANITSGLNVEATFAINTYDIVASAGVNGSITPAATTTANYGSNQIYLIQPASGYHVLDVLVDGNSVGAVGSYTFSNVTANHTISATFAINTPPAPITVYKITYLSGGGTGDSPLEPTFYKYGSNFTIPENRFVKNGYVFNGWVETSSGVIYNPSQTYVTSSGDVEFEATWTVEISAIVIAPGTPKIIIKPLDKYTLTTLKFGTVKAHASFVDTTANTYNLRISHDEGSSIRLSDKITKLLENKFVISNSDAGLNITAINGWTGKITVPVITVRNNQEVELFINITENPRPVLNPIISIDVSRNLVLRWEKDGSQVTGYVVTSGKSVICKVTKLTCVISPNVKPFSNLKIQSIGRDATKSILVSPRLNSRNFTVLFDTSSFALTSKSQIILNNLIKLAKTISVNSFTISGHTDSDGNLKSNTLLSKNRALAVQNYIKNQFKTAKIKIESHADAMPVASNKTSVGKSANRRVEISVG